MQKNLSYLELAGTIRSKNASATLADLLPLLPEYGITRLANITGLDNIGVPVYTCIRPLAKHLSVSQGKGLSPELAKISAIMEAIECYHLEHPPKIYAQGSHQELSSQYTLLNPLYLLQGFFNFTDRISELPIPWAEAQSMLNQQPILIPHALTHINSTILRPEFSYFSISSNGIAAGNSIDEAICHALYELIERDTFFKWGQFPEAKRQDSLLNLDSISYPSICTLIETLQLRGLEVKIWDINTQFNIPSFHCALYDHSPLAPLRFFSGTGTHLQQEVALARAITEAIQARTSLISGNRDDVFSDYYYQQAQICLQSSTPNPIGIKKLEHCATRAFTPSFSANISLLLEILVSHHYQNIFLINHSKKELGTPVVQIFVPEFQFTGARM